MGYTVSHINVIALVALVRNNGAFASSLFTRCICLRWNYKASIALHSVIRSRSPTQNSLLIFSEWLLLVVPLLLSMTLFAHRPGALFAVLIPPTAAPHSYAPFSRRTSLVHLYLQAASSLPVHHHTARRIHTTTSPPTEGGVSRGAQDDAFVLVEHLVPRAYDARNGARDPHS